MLHDCRRPRHTRIRTCPRAGTRRARLRGEGSAAVPSVIRMGDSRMLSKDTSARRQEADIESHRAPALPDGELPRCQRHRCHRMSRQESAVSRSAILPRSRSRHGDDIELAHRQFTPALGVERCALRCGDFQAGRRPQAGAAVAVRADGRSASGDTTMSPMLSASVCTWPPAMSR